MKLKATAVALVILTGLTIATPVLAHKALITATCQEGLDVNLSSYSKTDHHILVKIDGEVLVDTTFQQSFSFHRDFNQTVDHTWRVNVDALPDKSPHVHGTVLSCIEATTTTTSTPEATTTTVNQTTTTVNQATTTTFVPPSNTLPATGGAAVAGIAVFAGMLLMVGILLTITAVRLRRHVKKLDDLSGGSS